jgi:putative RecB family exonuclease
MDISHYKLSIFLRCPKQYWFEYLDPYTSKWEVKKQLKKPRPELEVGTFIHITLNNFFTVSKEKRSINTLKKLLEETWKPPRGEEKGFINKMEERIWYQDALKMLLNFYKFQTDPEHIFYVPDPHSREELIKVKINEKYSLQGKIDRIDKTERGLHIIDYKTGKGEDDEFQVMTYVLIAKNKYQLPVSRASYFYLRTGKFRSFDPTEQKEKATLKRIISVVEAIEREKDFVPRPTKLCGWCDYIDFCPAKNQATKLLNTTEKAEGLPF